MVFSETKQSYVFTSDYANILLEFRQVLDLQEPLHNLLYHLLSTVHLGKYDKQHLCNQVHDHTHLLQNDELELSNGNRDMK